MSQPMMACGHAANATDGYGRDCCAICMCTEVVSTPDLTGRKAKCTYCNHTVPSSTDLAFFSYEASKHTDDYYCGCLGWD